MEKEQSTEVLTGLIAAAFLHYKRIMVERISAPPTPDETKAAYLNDPIINRLTDAVVYGIIKLRNYPEDPDCSDIRDICTCYDGVEDPDCPLHGTDPY